MLALAIKRKWHGIEHSENDGNGEKIILSMTRIVSEENDEGIVVISKIVSGRK